MQRYDDSANRQNIRDTFFGKPSISHPYTLFIIRARREKAIKGILLTLLIYTLYNKCFKPHIKTHYSSLQGYILLVFCQFQVKNHEKHLIFRKKEERKKQPKQGIFIWNLANFYPETGVFDPKMNCSVAVAAAKTHPDHWHLKQHETQYPSAFQEILLQSVSTNSVAVLQLLQLKITHTQCQKEILYL